MPVNTWIMKENSATLPIIWCHPLDAGMSSYRKFLTADSRPVRCSIQSMILRMVLERPNLQFVAIDLDHVAIQRARRGAAQHLAIHGESRGMARADKIAGELVPVIRASQVCALRSEDNHLVLRRFHHPGGGFLATYLPAVHAGALESDLLGG